MLAPNKAYQNRQKFLTELRSGKHPQCKGNIGYWWKPKAPKCWLGVAFYVAGSYPGPWSFEEWWKLHFNLTWDQVQRLINLNDEGKTFQELADIQETLI